MSLTVAATFLWYLPLIFNWFKLENLKDEIEIGFVHYAVGAVALSTLQTLLIFWLRLAFQGIRNPENMVLLSSPMQLVNAKESHASYLLAINSIKDLMSTNSSKGSLDFFFASIFILFLYRLTMFMLFLAQEDKGISNLVDKKIVIK